MILNRKIWKRHGYTTRCRFVPSKSVFNQFGDHADAVKNEYEKVYETISHAPESTGLKHTHCSLLYNGGMSLVADKDFAGVPAGEDLSSIAQIGVLYEKENSALLYDSSIEFTHYFVTSYGNLDVNIDIVPRECQLVNDNVTLTLTVPVKSVQYLHWLNDCLSDENAPMTWKDDILSCTFTIDKAFR